jgi:predicted outer membrane protein
MLVAQERPRRAAPAAPQDPQRVTVQRPVSPAANADQQIAECLAIGNSEEAALGTLAASKSQNPQVKQFAEMLAKDHNQFIAQLQPFGGQRVEFGRANDVAERPAARDEVAERRTAADNRGGLDFAKIKREMAEKCLANAQKNWSEKQGNDADLCFVGSQAVLHQQMIDGQEVLRKYASPELQAVIDQGISSSRAHLEQAEKLLKQLTHAAKEPAREPTTN